MRTDGNDVLLRGNHDNNLYGTGKISDQTLLNIFDNNENRLYFYRDENMKKIRYIYLDSGESGTLDDVQLTWAINTITSLPADWHYVIVSHHGIYTTEFNQRVPSSYANVITQLEETVRSSAANIICWLSGHEHIDIYDHSKGFWIFSLTCDANGAQASTFSTDVRADNTINEQSLNVFQFNLAERKIYMTRIGGGQYNAITDGYEINDREFTF